MSETKMEQDPVSELLEKYDNLRDKINRLREEVSGHACDGHKELATQWVMNELRKLK